MWLGVNIFNILTGYLSILWFHEYWVGGRTEPDSMYSNWNGLSRRLWYLTAGASGYATYASIAETNQYPIATTANVLAVFVGLWFSGKTQVWDDRQAKLDDLMDHHDDVLAKYENGEDEEESTEPAQDAFF